MTRYRTLVWLAAAFAAAFEAQGVGATGPEDADLVLRNTAVYTLSPSRPWAEAVAIRDGRIRYVGDNAGAAALIGPHTTVLDLPGRMVLPGFQDAHVHPHASGLDFQQCPLFDGASADDYAAAVAACAARAPEGAWLVGAGWLLSAFPPDGIPRKELLDGVVADRPAVLISADGHTAWTNSRALAVAGIDANTPDPPKGRIDRDPATGEPVGSFQETAMDLVLRHVPPPDSETLERGLRYALTKLNGLGITAWQDASVRVKDDPIRALETYGRLNERGELSAHVVLSLLWDNSRGLEQIPELVAARQANSRKDVDAGTVKIFLDGVIEAQTAALLEDYTDRPGYRGELQVDPELLKEAVAALDAEGFQVHIHAIGDAAVRAALDAFEHARRRNGPGGNRHHVAHLQLIHPDDLERFAALDVTANFEPLWSFEDAYIIDLTYPRLGPERSRRIYPINDVLRAGGRIAFGSDWSVSSVNPLEGIEVAVTRMGPHGETRTPFLPDERIGLDAAIRAYTFNAAWLNRIDDRTGSIEAGKLADLVVLDRNLFRIDPTEISEARVLLTLFAGEPVAGSLEAAAAAAPGP
jgi:predicted amidohydrolase YtcJ